MKIKMTTTAVDKNLLCYNFGRVLTVGKDIEETFAKELVASNLAIIIEKQEAKEEVKEVKKRTRAKNKEVKKDEV